MWRVSRWAPLFFCLLQSVPGRFRLAPPRNVTLLSENFTVYLTWLPGLGNPPNVTYFVTYQGYPSSDPWRKVEQCAGTTALVCPMMCLKNQDLYRKFRGQVRAVSARGRSPWAVSPYLEYFFQVGLAPPTLVFTRMEKILWVNATYQLPPCVPSLDLKYDLEFWKEGEGNKGKLTEHRQPGKESNRWSKSGNQESTMKTRLASNSQRSASLLSHSLANTELIQSLFCLLFLLCLWKLISILYSGHISILTSHPPLP